MRVRSYALLAVLLAVSSASVALTRSSSSTDEVTPSIGLIDVDALHLKIDLRALPDAAAYDLI